MQLLWLCLIIVRFSAASARRIGSEPSGFPTHFDAPPVENANLSIFALLAIATLIQLGLASISLIRAGGHRIPALATIAALLFLLCSYILHIVFIIAQWTTDARGQPGFSSDNYASIDVATGVFTDWADPLVFAAVFLVLRNRYITYRTAESGEKSKSTLLLLPFTIAFGVLVTLLFVLSIAAEVVAGNFTKKLLAGPTVPSLSSRETADSLFHSLTAFYAITAILILAFAITVKISSKVDKIANITLFVIAPALVLRALVRIIIDVIVARRAYILGFDIEGVDLASTILYGGLYLVAASTLIFFLMMPRMWERMEKSSPQYGAYSVSGGQQQYQGGMQPPAQFPGQWGYTGQPQQPFPQPLLPGYAVQGMNYLNAQPQVPPPVAKENTAEGAPQPPQPA